MKAAGLLLLGAVVTMAFWVSQAQALPAFKKAFEQKYIAPSNNPALKAAFKKQSCNVCHVKGQEKTVRNDYGKALEKFTGGHVAKDIKAAKASGGDAAAKDVLDKAVKAIEEGFDKVGEEKSPSGDTYDEMIKAGKLP
ncbi:MAG TPA: hypothetical protein VHX65_05545 [Pirellulales bacterium]|nr:hypothetical protein [Pirellulales bacterium]